jgi:hypothetical protein
MLLSTSTKLRIELIFLNILFSLICWELIDNFLIQIPLWKYILIELTIALSIYLEKKLFLRFHLKPFFEKKIHEHIDEMVTNLEQEKNNKSEQEKI